MVGCGVIFMQFEKLIRTVGELRKMQFIRYGCADGTPRHRGRPKPETMSQTLIAADLLARTAPLHQKATLRTGAAAIRSPVGFDPLHLNDAQAPPLTRLPCAAHQRRLAHGAQSAGVEQGVPGWILVRES